MATLTLSDIHRARALCRRPAGGRRIQSDEDAACFIDERGFALLMPIRDLPLPSLSEAEGSAPWSDDFGCTDRAWVWKETLPARKLCAYSKLFRGRGTFISWRLYPSFVAVYGPAGDLAEEYEAGRLSRADRDLAELVAEYGPIDSHQLWRKAKPVFAGKRHGFLAALDRLQAGFVLTVAGGSLEGWTLHTWDLVERQAPAGLLDALPQTDRARVQILLQMLTNCVALPEQQARRILRWEPGDFARAVRVSLETGAAARLTVEGGGGSWLGMPA